MYCDPRERRGRADVSPALKMLESGPLAEQARPFQGPAPIVFGVRRIALKERQLEEDQPSMSQQPVNLGPQPRGLPRVLQSPRAEDTVKTRIWKRDGMHVARHIDVGPIEKVNRNRFRRDPPPPGPDVRDPGVG